MVVVNLYPFRSHHRQTFLSPSKRRSRTSISAALPCCDRRPRTMTMFSWLWTRRLWAVCSELFEKWNDPGAVRREMAHESISAHGALRQYDCLLSGTAGPGGRSKIPRRALSCNLNRRDQLRYERILTSRAPSTEICAARSLRYPRGKILTAKRCRTTIILDTESALELAKEFGETAVAIIKHNNPCGAALGTSPRRGLRQSARDDPVSAFGGVLAFNRPVDLAAAEEITSTFVEVVVAPGFEPDALTELKRKKDLRLSMWALDRGSAAATIQSSSAV